jgi:membrane-associated phospholipid phosphatase
MFLAAGITLVLSIPKPELHLFLNSAHGPASDGFFRVITFLGDGWFALVFSLVFVFYRWRYFLMMILSFSISGRLGQLLKRLVFPGAGRPLAFLEEMQGLALVEGVELHTSLSFPSGHTTTAFAVLVLAGLISRRRILVFTSILLACLVAYSRVYLSQHFLSDVLAGSVAGILSALFFYWYFRRLEAPWLDKKLFN